MMAAHDKSRQSITTTASFMSRGGGIFPWHFSQVYASARIATQSVISQAITLLRLLVVLGGCLGLLGIAFSTISAQPSSAPLDVFHPVEPVVSGKTIRYDRTPKRPSVFAITIAVVVAIVVLAVAGALYLRDPQPPDLVTTPAPTPNDNNQKTR